MFESSEKFRQRVGHVDVGVSLDFRSRGQVLRDFVLAILLVIAFIALTLWSAWPSLQSVAIAVLVFAAYCAIAYFLRVRPNHDQIGLHPGRWSDGANRALIQLAIVFAIGRFISLGLVDGIRLLRRGQLPQDKLMQDLESQEQGGP